MKKLALLLSLLALGALGLVACGGGDDDEGTPAEATVSPDTTAEARFPAETGTEACERLSRVDPQKHEALLRRCSRKLSPEQVQELERGKQARDLRRAANNWASRFAVRRCPEHEIHLFPGEEGYVNCKRVSAAFQKSFADATVEDIKFKGVAVIRPSIGLLYRATVKFSNGEVVAFVGPDLVGECAAAGAGCPWYVADRDHNRRFFQAATLPAKPSPELVQALRRVANDWASLFATNNCNRYMGQPVCERLDCERHSADPPDWSKDCTPVSAAFQKSFADATVEDIALKGIAVIGKPVAEPVYRAAVKFSNGEVVVFSAGVKQPEWGIAPPNRRLYQAAAQG